MGFAVIYYKLKSLLRSKVRLDDEDSGDGLKLVSGSYGMDVPSACTIVIIAGNLISLKL